MGLSVSAEEKISGLQTILEFIQAVKPFFNDPDIMNKWSKEAYSLPDSEKAQADEARGKIAEYRGLIADLSNKKSVLDTFHESLLQDQKIHQENVDKFNEDQAIALSELEKTKELLAQERGNIDRMRSDLDERDVAQSIRDHEIKESLHQLEVVRAKIRKEQEEFANQKAELAAYEANLKARASQLHQLTEGL